LCYFWSFTCRLKQMQFLIAFHFGFSGGWDIGFNFAQHS
jgi:hypothetical protein